MDFEDILIGIFVSLFGIFMVGVLLVLPLGAIFWGTQTPGDGVHSGYVTATESGGIFWKTDRAYIKTDNQSSQEDAYCVVNEEVLAQLRTFQEQKQRVNVTYTGKLFVPKSECRNEEATIIKVEAVTN